MDTESFDYVSVLSSLSFSYVLLIGIVYYIFSAGVSEFLKSNIRVYYFILGGLIDFKNVNWFIYCFLFFMGWFAMVYHESHDSFPDES